MNIAAFFYEVVGKKREREREAGVSHLCDRLELLERVHGCLSVVGDLLHGDLVLRDPVEGTGEELDQLHLVQPALEADADASKELGELCVRLLEPVARVDGSGYVPDILAVDERELGGDAEDRVPDPVQPGPRRLERPSEYREDLLMELQQAVETAEDRLRVVRADDRLLGSAQRCPEFLDDRPQADHKIDLTAIQLAEGLVAALAVLEPHAQELPPRRRSAQQALGVVKNQPAFRVPDLVLHSKAELFEHRE